MRELRVFVREVFQNWKKHNTSMLAAALAYYSVLSSVPLLLIVVTLAGYILGETIAQQQLAIQLHTFVGSNIAQFVQDVLKNIGTIEISVAANIFGLGIFLFGSLEVFYKLQIALNTIWEVEKEMEYTVIRRIVRKRLISFLIVMGVGALLFFSFIMGTSLSIIGQLLVDVLPDFSLIVFWQYVEIIGSFAVITWLLAIAYRSLPDSNISWKDVSLGAVIGSLLFIFGKIGIGWYFSTRNFGSLYGAAGSLVAFLIWIYYSAQIFLFGAEVTHSYAYMFGSKKHTATIFDTIKHAVKRVKK